MILIEITCSTENTLDFPIIDIPTMSNKISRPDEASGNDSPSQKDINTNWCCLLTTLLSYLPCSSKLEKCFLILLVQIGSFWFFNSTERFYTNKVHVFISSLNIFYLKVFEWGSSINAYLHVLTRAPNLTTTFLNSFSLYRCRNVSHNHFPQWKWRHLRAPSKSFF